MLQTEFAKSTQAKTLNLKKADFSYQSKKGKCETCKGYGELKTSMDFMSDVWIPCDTCNGNRYHPQINACKISGLNDIEFTIGDLLQLTATELIGLFENDKLNTQLQHLIDLGLGHLQLGQAANSLSGGEAQRLKLATALTNTKGLNLYLFDEPSNGLHQLDLVRLIHVFENLIDQGHTVIFIEHHPSIITIANEQIKLGPGSGNEGGRLVTF